MLYRHRSVIALALGMLVVGGLARSAAAQDAAVLRGRQAPPHALWLESLDLGQVEQGWKQPQAGKSVEKHPITLHGATFARGLGTHAESTLRIVLKQAAVKFVSMVGVDDEVGKKGLVAFEVWVDGKKKAESGLMRGGDQPKLLSVDLTGAKELVLTVVAGSQGIDSAHADWAGAMLVLAPGATAKPVAAALPEQPRPEIVLEHSPQPAIHSPRITGSTPGRPFLFMIPATGKAPLKFSAENLPAGLVLDAQTGIITGSLLQAGTTRGGDRGGKLPG